MTTDPRHEPGVSAATLVHFAVADMLHQYKFSYAHFPELIDLAVIGTGLGMLRANVPLVNNKGNYWDTTHWLAVPKPFLDAQAFAYAKAIAAWARDDKEPNWSNDLPAELKGPMKKSLKYLNQTNDSFFQTNAEVAQTLDRPQSEWWKLLEGKPLSTKIVATNRLLLDAPVTQQQASLLVELLRSNNRALLLHTIGTAERMASANESIVDESIVDESIVDESIVDESIVDELRLLVEHRDNEVRAKAMFALTKLARLDEGAMRQAAKMLESKVRFVTFAGIVALASKQAIPSSIMPALDRGFVQSLQNCDYEFMGLYAAAYQNWVDDPTTHFQALLERDSPEFLEMALEAFQNAQEQLIALE